MKERSIYYRRKGKSIIIEGKQDGRSIPIWTLPNDPTQLLDFLTKASFFTEEKSLKIQEKIRRLDIRKERGQKEPPKVHII